MSLTAACRPPQLAQGRAQTRIERLQLLSVLLSALVIARPLKAREGQPVAQQAWLNRSYERGQLRVRAVERLHAGSRLDNPHERVLATQSHYGVCNSVEGTQRCAWQYTRLFNSTGGLMLLYPRSGLAHAFDAGHGRASWHSQWSSSGG